MKVNIKELNKALLRSIDKSYPIGLTNGTMGLSIYFYHLSRIENNEDYKVIADQLLDDTLNRLSFDSPIQVENGLAGIALGVTHLIKNSFVEGNVNELLENIDNSIFKNIAFIQSNSSYKKEELLHLLYYLYVRLIKQTEENHIYIFQELIIKVINIFVTELSDQFFDESFSFSVYNFHLPLFTYICACLLKENFYNNRIYKILEEYEPKILSKFPVLHANRLYMLCGMLPLIPYMKNPKWKLHADLLYKEIKLQTIFDKEMLNKHIFVSNGLSFIYILLFYINNNHLKYQICYNSFDFYNRINVSEAWESLSKHDYFFEAHQGLLQGFPGVHLVLLHIQTLRKK